MANLATLSFDNTEDTEKKYDLIDCSYTLKRSMQKTGIPASYPQGKTITFTLTSPSDDDIFLHDWMRNKNDPKSGMITFMVVNNFVTDVKTLHFKNAYCLSLEETFFKLSEAQMYTKITICATEIGFGKEGNIAITNDK